jgi:chromosomal replication initiator protein
VADQGIDLKRKPELTVVEPSAPPLPPEAALPPGIDARLPEQVQSDASAPTVPPMLGIRTIQRAVCEHYGVSLVDLLSSRRTKAIVLPRQVAVWLCRRLTPHSLPAIGPHFGGRDHTTMLHSARRIDELRQSDPAMQAKLDAFIAALAPA